MERSNGVHGRKDTGGRGGSRVRGLWATRALAGKGVQVQLLDRNNFHTFLPLLYQVAAAELSPTDIAYPVRSIIRKEPNVHFRLGSLENIDLKERMVVTQAERIPYDHLILALGSVPHYFGVKGFRNRILVMVNWAWNYLSFERAVRLILPYRPDRERNSTSEIERGQDHRQRLSNGA